MLARAKRVGIYSLRMQRRSRLPPIPTFPLSGAGQSHLREKRPVAILRDARLWRASQDDVLCCGTIVDPHGEERRLRRVSNHEAGFVRSGPRRHMRLSCFQGEGEERPVARMEPMGRVNARPMTGSANPGPHDQLAIAPGLRLAHPGRHDYFGSPAVKSTDERPAALYVLLNANCAPAGCSGVLVSSSSDQCGPAEVCGSLKSTSPS